MIQIHYWVDPHDAAEHFFVNDPDLQAELGFVTVINYPED